MVDATDLIIITSVAQTLVLSLTLVIFIFQFRSQEKSLKEATYQNVMGRYTDTMRMMIDKPELNKLMNQMRAPGQDGAVDPEELSQEDRTQLAFMLVMFGILEETYVLYCKKWIDKDSWDQWSNLLETVSKNPLFPRLMEGSGGSFDPRFERYVEELVRKSD